MNFTKASRLHNDTEKYDHWDDETVDYNPWDDETVKSKIAKLSKSSALVDLSDEDETIQTLKSPFYQRSTPFVKGMIQAFPIVIGFIPLSFAYGVMAQDIGLSLLAAMLMSIIVFAGSSQYIAVGMIAGGQPVLTIVFTTFIVNLRHLLLSTSIAPYLSKWKPLQRIIFASQLTDEAFALHSLRFPTIESLPARDMATNSTAHVAWILGTFLGYMAGSILSDIKIFGLDFALSAMFIALLVMQIKERIMLLISLLSGALALVFVTHGLKTWSVIMATLIGATIGMGFELWMKKRSS